MMITVRCDSYLQYGYTDTMFQEDSGTMTAAAIGERLPSAYYTCTVTMGNVNHFLGLVSHLLTSVIGSLSLFFTYTCISGFCWPSFPCLE